MWKHVQYLLLLCYSLCCLCCAAFRIFEAQSSTQHIAISWAHPSIRAFVDQLTRHQRSVHSDRRPRVRSEDECHRRVKATTSLPPPMLRVTPTNNAPANAYRSIALLHCISKKHHILEFHCDWESHPNSLKKNPSNQIQNSFRRRCVIKRTIYMTEHVTTIEYHDQLQ